MFTGIIQAVGTVSSWSNGVLWLDPKELDLDRLQIGESIAINGVCLTVVAHEKGLLSFDLSDETVSITTFKHLSEGKRVNLERALALGDRLGGHIVQGHVDGLGNLVKRREEGNAIILTFTVPNQRYVIHKGSITINGVSLTVVDPSEGSFDVWVIPHTLENTQLGDLKPGDEVNIEYDVVAKYVENLSRFANKT